MITDEIIQTICPCCGNLCFMVEKSDGNGGITPIFSNDSRWLEDSEESALIDEQGANVPNCYSGGEQLMPGKGCKGHRKHTPITSTAQRGKFGAEYARRKAGKKQRMKGITTKELRSHLKESKGKKLPKSKHKKKKK